MPHPNRMRDRGEHSGHSSGAARSAPKKDLQFPRGSVARVETADYVDVSPRRVTARRYVLPFLPIVFGLGEIEAATALGISASNFRRLIKEGRMPSPRRLDGRNIWDVDELRAAFKAIPHAGESELADSWADVV